MSRPVCASLWTVRRAFGVAGGPLELALTDKGVELSFSVGAQVRIGPPANALKALHAAGGEGALSTAVGVRLRATELGRFDQIAWGRLKALGYVESADNDRVRLTECGRLAVMRGFEEGKSLLQRVQEAHGEALTGAGSNE